MNLLRHIGASVLFFLNKLGSIVVFLFNTVKSSVQYPWYFKQIWNHFLNFSFYSLPVVGMTAVFTGMVLALQSYTGFSRFSAESTIATVVVLSMTRELGPVLAGLMVAGRVGAAIAAEIGTMRVSEQLDALVTLRVNPFQYLFWPYFLSGIIALPLLVIVADVIGVLGGYLVSVHKLNFNASQYLHQTIQYLEVDDVMSGVIKSSAFGGIIALMGCYHGYNSNHGAQGVGQATTKAVVSASIIILLMNYVLTNILFQK
jgi:phospholipid/cholesterol/gamma-HCH transport system permease protein